MLVSTRLLEAANSRSLRPLSFVNKKLRGNKSDNICRKSMEKNTDGALHLAFFGYNFVWNFSGTLVCENAKYLLQN